MINVSYRLKHLLKDLYPELQHVTDFNLTKSTDLEIVKFAEKNNYCIVTFDSDFIDLVTFHKSKVKVIWLRTGNTTTKMLAEVFRNNNPVIENFLSTGDTLFLEIR